nr:hypothetical protein [Morchella crassipes]
MTLILVIGKLLDCLPFILIFDPVFAPPPGSFFYLSTLFFPPPPEGGCKWKRRRSACKKLIFNFFKKFVIRPCSCTPPGSFFYLSTLFFPPRRGGCKWKRRRSACLAASGCIPHGPPPLHNPLPKAPPSLYVFFSLLFWFYY